MHNEMVEMFAKICHEVNRAYCKSMGDLSQPEWESAPDWQIQSAIDGVEFHLKHPEATPEDSHKNWLKMKEAEGWKYGEVKNPELKLHPCMVPYSELPLSQQTKDALFIAVINCFPK